MNFNDSVEKEVVDAILESSLWRKSGIEVKPRTVNESSAVETEDEIGTIPEYEDKKVANRYEEPSTIDAEDAVSGFTLDDLQVVLDNLEDEDLMEHALTMLDVFDVAYETLLEGDDDEDEEEEEEEEETAAE